MFPGCPGRALLSLAQADRVLTAELFLRMRPELSKPVFSSGAHGPASKWSVPVLAAEFNEILTEED